MKRNSQPVAGEFPLPCGQCIECKLERTRQWAVRIKHEASLHASNYFATFTYSDNPISLHYPDFQKFLKRLRKQYPGVRYFMCGEYGEKKDRPHFHAALFNLSLPDLQVWKESKGNVLSTSRILEKIWGHGFVLLGDLTFESASYVASYCTKKISGAKADSHYQVVDLDTGEISYREPEFARMSLKPAIAKPWFEKYQTDVTNHDHVIINGREQKPPRYYDKLLEESHPNLLLKNKTLRKIKAISTNSQNTYSQLQSRKKMTLSRLSLKTRSL